MKSVFSIAVTFGLLSTGAAFAQSFSPFTTDGTENPATVATTASAELVVTTSESLDENSPSVNASGAAVRSRGPGTIVSAARTRHTDLATDRKAFQLAGGNASATDAPGAGGSGGGSDSLTDLISGLLGGGDISGLLGLLGGDSTDTTTDPNATVETGGSSTGGGSNLTPEAIQLLTDSGFNVDELVKARADKLSQRQQTATPTVEEDPFRIRLADALLSQLFTSLIAAFLTPDFVSFLEDQIRPILRPDLTDDGSSKAISSEIESRLGNDNDPRFPRLKKIKQVLGGF